jgi:hypothetical protein
MFQPVVKPEIAPSLMVTWVPAGRVSEGTLRRTGLPVVPDMVAAVAHVAEAEQPIVGTGEVSAVAGWTVPPTVTVRVPLMVVDPEFFTVRVSALTPVDPEDDAPEARPWTTWMAALLDAEPARL